LFVWVRTLCFMGLNLSNGKGRLFSAGATLEEAVIRLLDNVQPG
jgi:hypothetical protein